jgi:spermidine/putrescine transport system permease protein
MITQNNPLWRFAGVRQATWLFFLFLYVPILVLVALSFNSGQSATLWAGFSLKWYGVVANDPEILRAAKNSLIVATSATIIATVLATLAALGMHGRAFRGQNMVNGVLGLPLLIPDIVSAVAILMFFSLITLKLSLFTIMIAHVVFCTPFAYMPIRARLQGMNPALLEAAADLYAPPWKVFWKVSFPLLMPGILAGAMMAFIISMDDFVITYFVAGAGSTTLPIYIFSSIRMGISPKINAISTIMLLISIAFVALSYYIGQRKR